MENKKPENPQAFAMGYGTNNYNVDQPGMTLRDYFANSAMQAFLTSPELMEVVTAKELQDESCFEALARVSYKIADAMLKIRTTN